MTTFFFGGDDAAIDIAGLGFSNRATSVLESEAEEMEMYTSPSRSSAGVALTPPTGQRMRAKPAVAGLQLAGPPMLWIQY
jgi:hypothetical protein